MPLLVELLLSPVEPLPVESVPSFVVESLVSLLLSVVSSCGACCLGSVGVFDWRTQSRTTVSVP